MIDEKLREEMTNAFVDGDYDKALELSKLMDIQILESYSYK